MPCRCGHSWTVGPSPSPGIPAGRQRPGVQQLDRVPAAQPPRPPSPGSRPGAASRSRRPTRPPGRTSPQRGGEQFALQPGQRRQVGRAARRQRASGRRRSAPSPVHGASTSTRSNPPAGSVGPPTRGRRRGCTSPAARRAACSTSRPGAGRPRPRSPGRRAARPARPAGRLAARAGAQVEPALVPAVERRRRQGGAPAGEPSSWTWARPVAHRRQVAGRAAGQVDRVRRVRARPARRPRRPARRGRSGRAGRTGAPAGGSLSAASSRPRSRPVAAQRVGEGPDDPARMRVRPWPGGRPGRAPRSGASRSSQSSRSLLGDPAQHRVDEPGRAAARPPGPGRRWSDTAACAGTRVCSSW